MSFFLIRVPITIERCLVVLLTNILDTLELHILKDERIETLGAIPKRRSPQQVALGIKGDGIEGFLRIKTGKKNLNMDKEQKREKEKRKNKLIKHNET